MKLVLTMFYWTIGIVLIGVLYNEGRKSSIEEKAFQNDIRVQAMKNIYPSFMSDCQKTQTFTCCKHDFDYNVLKIFTSRPDFCSKSVGNEKSGSSVGTGIGVGVGMEIGKSLIR